MPQKKVVDDFIDAVVNGDHVLAIEKFYTTDASMQENSAPPRVGREKLIQHERSALARIHTVKTHAPDTVLVDGNHVMILWTIDTTDKNGITRRLNEVALQLWDGDRISKERFVYDTATAWEVV